MNRDKVNEWLENTFSEYTKEEDRKESIFYLLKKVQDDSDKEMERFLLEINDAKNEIFRLNSLNCNDCIYYLSDNESFPLEPCSECSRFYSDSFIRKAIKEG